MQRQDLERLSREELIAEAERLGVPRPRTLTQPELVDEILGRATKGDRERARARGWLGRARDLLARVVERGLHLPEAARAIRREAEEKGWPAPPPPLPTVTLAEIYAAQGHLERALAVLEEVLTREPEHKEARAMKGRFLEQAQRSRARVTRETSPPPVEPTAGATAAPSPPVQPYPPSEPVSQPLAAAAPVEPPSEPSMQAPAAAAPSLQQPPEEKPAEPPAVVEEAEPALPVAAAATGPVEASPPLAVDATSSPATEGAVSVAPPEDPPLPDRYEVDEVVAIAVDPRTIYLYWEVRATTLARARAERPEGGLAVRVATVVASWEGPIVEARDLPVDSLYGDRFVRDVRPGSNVRVSVGWLAGSAFDPFAVGAEVTAPRVTPVESVAQEIARWEAAPVVAAFANRGASFQADRAEPAVPAALMWPRAPGRRDGGAPIDTGVMRWSGASVHRDASALGAEAVVDDHIGEEIHEPSEPTEDLVRALGSSELVRLPRTRARARRAPILTWTPSGASDLSR